MHERNLQHKGYQNREIHKSNYKRLRNTINTKMKKAKCDYYSTKLSNELNPKEMWKTLNEVLPKKNNTALGASKELSATKFNKFFTTIAENLCRVYKKNSPLQKF